MPLHQISVIPVRETASNGRSSVGRNKEKNKEVEHFENDFQISHGPQAVQKLKRDKRKEKMLGWCEAIARNPHRIPNNTRTPEISGDLADASQTSTLIIGRGERTTRLDETEGLGGPGLGKSATIVGKRRPPGFQKGAPLLSCVTSNMTAGSHVCCNFLNMWKKSKISTMYYLNQDAKLSNLFLQASSPTTGTAPRSQSRLSVCPSTQDICRSAILHDMSEDAFEQCTPVMVLSPARKESGKKSVKQRPRRRRRASERYEPAEEQIKGRRNDFHLQITSPRWSELYADSSDSSSTDETHWIQAKRRAQVKFRLSRRRRRNGNKPCGNVDGPSAPHGMDLVDVESKGKKQQELTECASCSLNLCRGKGIRCQECSLSLPQGSFEIKRSSREHEESKGRYHHRDLQLLHRLGQYETVQKRLSEADCSTDILAVAEGGKYVDAATFQVNNSVQKPPATYHDGSDNLKMC
ncbi:hypothetical protein GH733_011943, partial [Mirounga leonina]